MSIPKTSTAHQPSSYSPPGCSMPVMTHLTEAEKYELSELAKKELRSMSATVRMFVVEGMERYKNKTE